MKKNVSLRYAAVACLLASLLLGCQEAQTKIENPFDSKPQPTVLTRKDVSKSRFEETAAQGPSAVESAIELSKKYSALLEDLDKLRQENQRLMAENTSLKERVGPCETQLTQTQKELTEANDLLIEMRIELNNWKTNVLGFRDEIRQADQAQLEALLKILRVLGGEIEDQPDSAEAIAPNTPAQATSADPAGPTQDEDNTNG